MERAILLQIDDTTTSKRKALREFSDKALSEFNRLFEERDFCLKFMDFHRKVYSATKKNTSFNAQVICDIERRVWKSKGKARRITAQFNIPRNCKTFSAKSLDFVELGLYPRNRVAVPLVKNRNWQRYHDLLAGGWNCKTYGLTSDLQIVAYLNKEEVGLPPKRNILGVDVNSKCFAISVVSPEGKVLHQDYFGKDIWVRRKKIFERKGILRSHFDRGSSYAGKALEKTKRDEHNFVKNRIGEVVRDITDLALRFDADISIENLHRFSPEGRKFNREVMRIPFFTFKNNLIARCADKEITLNIVDAWHTSKFCNHCGAVGKGHDSSNYALFRCKKCGVLANSDRNAGTNIAIKSLLERKDVLTDKTFQISNRRVPVNGLVRSDEVGLSQVAVQHSNHSDGMPIPFRGG